MRRRLIDALVASLSRCPCRPPVRQNTDAQTSDAVRLGGQPEGSSQASIAELRQPSLAAEHAGLVCRRIEATELQELAMVAETAQVAGFSQDGERDDGSDAGQLAE